MSKWRHLFKPAYAWIVLGILLFFLPHAIAGVGNLPGTDESQKLEAAGTLLRLIDTALFKWGARLFAGLCILSGAWALKEQRFAMAIIAVIGAIVIGTAPTWVKNIFSISSDNGIFGYHSIEKNRFVASVGSRHGPL